MHRRSVALAAAVLAAVTACSSQDPAAAPRSDDEAMSIADARAMGHVHGVGVDPGDGTLYAASHFGVFRINDGTPERVADRWQDTMGFAVVGPGHFLGSGHPDVRDDLPTSLGLIESTDGAESWQPVSLLGDADLHAIEPVADRIYAYDSHAGTLIVTTDREQWDTITRAPVLDLAANPDDPDTVYATTDRGRLVRSINRGPLTRVAGAPALTAIEWEPDGPLVGATPDGTVMTSSSGTSGWQETGSLDGPVQALDASPRRWHAATETGIYESTDHGTSWKRVLNHHG